MTFTLPGTPLIYYGQERGVTEQRGTMRWHDGDDDLTDFHRRLVGLRQSEPALRSGSVEPVSCSVSGADASTVVAYERTAGDDSLLVVVNFGADDATVSFDGEVDLSAATDLISTANVGSNESIHITDAVVLRLD